MVLRTSHPGCNPPVLHGGGVQNANCFTHAATYLISILVSLLYFLAFGVNMFFDVPAHPNPVLYTNLAYSVPMNILQSFGGTVDVQIDIPGTLAMHLDQVNIS